MNPICIRVVSLAALVTMSLLLVGCGNKGPLVMAPMPASAEVPALDSPPATEPTDSETAPVLPPPVVEPTAPEPDPDGDG